MAYFDELPSLVYFIYIFLSSSSGFLWVNCTKAPSTKLLSTDSSKIGFCERRRVGVSTLIRNPSLMNIILPETKCLMMYFFFDLFFVVFSYSSTTKPAPKVPVCKFGVTVCAKKAWSVAEGRPSLLLDMFIVAPNIPNFLGPGVLDLFNGSSCFSAFYSIGLSS